MAIKATKMTKKLKDAWVKALRSGRYKQTRDVLARDVSETSGKVETAYCCLGVLCRLAGVRADSLRQAECYADGDSAGDINSFFEHHKLSPVLNTYIQRQLVDMNDAQKALFETIADYIDSLSVEQLRYVPE